MEVFGELIKREPNLLSMPLSEIMPIRFIGDIAVTAYKAMIKNLDPYMTEEQKAKTLKDGQDAGVMLLAIETKVGNDSPRMPDGLRKGTEAKQKAVEVSDFLEKNRITPTQVTRSRIIANNPEIVEEVIKEAEENEDIPTKTAVIKAVKIKQMERQSKYNTKPADPKPDVNKELFKISETLGGLRGRIDRMDGLQDVLNETFCSVIIDNCNRIIEVLGGTE